MEVKMKETRLKGFAVESRVVSLVIMTLVMSTWPPCVCYYFPLFFCSLNDFAHLTSQNFFFLFTFLLFYFLRFISSNSIHSHFPCSHFFSFSSFFALHFSLIPIFLIPLPFSSLPFLFVVHLHPTLFVLSPSPFLPLRYLHIISRGPSPVPRHPLNS